MFTRILLAVFVSSVMFISPIQSHTQNSTPLPPAVTVDVRSPATGRHANIPATERLSSLPSGNTVVIYEAEITPAVLSSLVYSDQAWDSSHAVKVTIWMYFDSLNSGGHTYTSINHYSTMWQLYDYSISMSNASINAGCGGTALPGYQSCYDYHQYSSIGIPSSGVQYSIYPFWAGNYVITSEYLGYQAGNSKVQLKRGSSTTWWLQICIFKGSCAIN